MLKEGPVRPDFKHIKAESVDPIVIDRDEYVQINEHISRYLKKYQVQGAKFMYNAYKSNIGCILAGETLL